jgi:hypothetical protein
LRDEECVVIAALIEATAVCDAFFVAGSRREA